MKNNIIYLNFKKSDRKNAKISNLIRISYLIGKNEPYADKSILKHFIYIFDECINELKILNTDKIILSYSVFIEKDIKLENNKTGVDRLYIKHEYKNIELYELIEELNYMFLLIYPYNNISLKTILNNPSIKYIIKEYENNKEGVKNEWL